MVHSIIELLYNRVKYRVILFFHSIFGVQKQDYSIFYHWGKSNSIIELLYFRVKYILNFSVSLEMV